MDDETYRKTWAGELFGPNGSLARVRAEAEAKRKAGDPVGGEVSLVSQLYTAAKQCLVHWRERPWRLTLLLWAIWHGFDALNRARRVCHYHMAKLDHNQLDVLGAVFLRAHGFGHAQACYEAAFRLIQRRTRDCKWVSPHEEALVLCGYARIRELQGATNDRIAAEEFYREALALALQRGCNSKQRVRILRAVAEFFIRSAEVPSAIQLLTDAKSLAEQEQMPDQVLQVEQTLRRARQLLPSR